MNTTGLHLHTSPAIEVLADAFAATVTVSVADPFARPLVLTPGSGMQRWLSQRLASATAEGISAGLEFAQASRLERLVSEPCPGTDDPWSPERLVWGVLGLADADAEGLAPLVHHLAASDQRYANALRVARLLDSYATHRPEMLAEWSRAAEVADLGLAGDAWQAHLWRHLRRQLSDPDPVERRAALASRLTDGSAPVPWPAASVFAPRATTPVQIGLLRALASRVRVDVWLPVAGPASTDDPLARALGRRGRGLAGEWADACDTVERLAGPSRPASCLGALQAGVDAGARVPAAADHTVSLHAGHGPARQVEVLREILVGALADDPSLEPRDVVVTCPDPASLAPHLVAAFGSGGHPAVRLRVQVGGLAASDVNRLAPLLADLVELGGSRATSADLLRLAAHPFVARRFSFTPDDLDRLGELVGRASIRWGLNPAHRERFGLAGVIQNTWQLGVQRLLLGEAFSDDSGASAGVVATVDDVTSTDAALLGSLAELVSRVSRLVAACATPAPAALWVDRFRSMLTSLVDVPFDEAWQESQAWSVLQSVAARAEGSQVALTGPDALALLRSGFADHGLRPAFGNGSLVVCGLRDLAQVPHRVVCLVGLDDAGFPRRGLGDGDDLLARQPRRTDPDPGLDDRQSLLDALLSARERLVVVYQGHSSLTNESYPPPSGLVDLVDAVGEAHVRHEALQAFGEANFTGPQPRSFDAGALRAARAARRPRTPAPDRWAVGHLHRDTPFDAVDLASLTHFLRHPARYHLRERAGLTLWDEEAPSTELPLELTDLSRWAVGDAMLAGLLAGRGPDAVRHAAWLSGDVPPFQLGARPLADIADQAQGVHRQFTAAVPAGPVSHLVDLDVDGVRVTGLALTRGGLVADCHFGRTSPRHLADAWVRVLALSVALARPTDALLVGAKGATRLKAPPVDAARSLLGDLVALARHGTEQVLPLPVRLACLWAEARVAGRDPLEDRKALRRAWKYDLDDAWRPYFDEAHPPWEATRAGADPWGRPAERTVLGALAAIAWEPIVRATA